MYNIHFIPIFIGDHLLQQAPSVYNPDCTSRYWTQNPFTVIRGEPRGSPGRGTPGKIEFSAPRSPGKILKNPRGKSNNKLAEIDRFYQQNVIF